MTLVVLFSAGEFPHHKGAGLFEERLAGSVSRLAELNQVVGNREAFAGQIVNQLANVDGVGGFVILIGIGPQALCEAMVTWLVDQLHAGETILFGNVPVSKLLGAVEEGASHGIYSRTGVDLGK